MSTVHNILQEIYDATKSTFSFGSKLEKCASQMINLNENRILMAMSKVMYIGIYRDLTSREPFEMMNITDEDINALAEFAPELSSYPILEGRICDALWHYKNELVLVQQAINGYLNAAKEALSLQDGFTATRDYLERAMAISRPLRKDNNPDYQKCVIFLHEMILKRKDEFPAVLMLIDIALEYSIGTLCEYIPIIDNRLRQIEPDIFQNEYAVKRLFELKLRISKKLKIPTKSVYEHYAKSLECIAERLLSTAEKDNRNNHILAINRYEQAVLNYRQASKPEEAKRVRLLMEPLKRKRIENMARYEQRIDMTENYGEIRAFLDGTSFADKILALGAITGFHTKEALEKRVIENAHEFLGTSLFGSNLLDRDGRLIIAIPPLDQRDPKKDIALLEQHMHREAYLSYSMTFMQEMVFHCILNDHPDIQESELDFLIDHNVIIPEDRKRIFKLGLLHGLKGELYMALHLLVPQMENLFRELAKLCGGLTTSFGEDTSEQALVLSSIFNAPELLDAYNNDVLFAFQGLLNEKAGANLRNNIAHGLTNSAEGASGISLFFLSAVIKILSWYTEADWRQKGMAIREDMRKIEFTSPKTLPNI